jgi:hypothetical protein
MRAATPTIPQILTCAALLAAIFPGVALADLDRSVVYEVPAATAATMPISYRLLVKACARKKGIRWKIKSD